MSNHDPAVRSILDSDLYKFTMMAAVLKHYENTPVQYRFSNRRKEGKFNNAFVYEFESEIDRLCGLKVEDKELDWFSKTCPFLTDQYFEFLRNYRFNKNELRWSVEDGELNLSVNSSWELGILWEVPLMSIISECFFRTCDTEWEFNVLEQEKRIRDKAKILTDVTFADFGTRRRRSYDVQDLVVKTLVNCAPNFVGTSNVSLAMKHNTKPIGTLAHEWIMATSVLMGLRHANKFALDAWSEVFNGDLGIALTDTYGSKAFFEDFDGYLARLFDGVRHDSGDPFEFARKAITHYKSLGINPMSKTIVFSDGLTAKLAAEINERFKDVIRCSFGIGTHFTNDFHNSKALNMVIKLWSCEGVPLVKLGDDEGKAIGDPDAVRVARWVFNDKPLDN